MSSRKKGKSNMLRNRLVGTRNRLVGTRNRIRSKLKKFRERRSKKKRKEKLNIVEVAPGAATQEVATPGVATPGVATPGVREKKTSPKKSKSFKPIQEVEVTLLNEKGKPISMSETCKPIKNEDKKGVALLEILNDIAIKKKDTSILKDILAIELDFPDGRNGGFFLLTEIISILKKNLGFALGRMIYSAECLKQNYQSLNDNNLKTILQNLKTEIGTN
jgi:hypothetical protein